MAHLYQYHKKKVRYIGYIGAGGTGTKLSYHKKYLVYGGHHFSCRVRVKNGVGRIDTSAGIYLNNVPYYQSIIKNESFLKNELVKGRQKKMIIMQNATR